MKDKIRKEMIEKREFHHSTGGHRHCISIMDQFLHLPEFNDSKCIMLYWSKGSEVHTDGIIESALSLKKKVVLPVTKKEEKKLLLFELKDTRELVKGAFDIMEPLPIPDRAVDPKEIDLVVVPGVSFDRRGHRIGYGMGYYDSLLKEVHAKKIGLAYGLQILEHVPNEPHDVAVDMIVTEEGVIACGEGASAGQKKLRVAVLASGKGSDFQSIIDGVKSGKVAAEIVALITDNPDAGAIVRAKENGIQVHTIAHKTREELDERLLQKLNEISPDLVVLAGYMKVIKNERLLSAYSGKIINIHPSLLPKYPGAHAQKDAFDAGEKVSGYTIHFVDASLDGGPIIYQEKVDISGCKTADEASAKILEREHIGLPETVDRFAKGKFEAKGGKVIYKSNL
ncbi:MAG: phosphoribosylglycinamide formyltransferase [Candidatus Micrarchaeota archaeon]|nr:phosphoribosylglycinamide formyltransferase [Candidatus Micrarchaeota archaeon]